MCDAYNIKLYSKPYKYTRVIIVSFKYNDYEDTIPALFIYFFYLKFFKTHQHNKWGTHYINCSAINRIQVYTVINVYIKKRKRYRREHLIITGLSLNAM